MAISACKKKNFRSILKAAKVFEVPETTLHEWLAGVKPQSETCASGHKLTEIEEESLVKQLLDADKQGFPIQPGFLCEMAQIYTTESYSTWSSGLALMKIKLGILCQISKDHLTDSVITIRTTQIDQDCQNS